MRFKGTPHEQALYLLRNVKQYAHLGQALTKLPAFIDSLMNNNVNLISKPHLKAWLQRQQIPEQAVGGPLDGNICDASGIAAGYFVIHDASNLLNGAKAFPDNVNTDQWWGNNLQWYQNFKYAHLFINRLGESLTCNDLSKKINATKFESTAKNPTVGQKCLGTFVHVELIQPRISALGKHNDAVAIEPGFTDEQYHRLAIFYVTASTRAGKWLIPTFHAVVDEGLSDGHDDPQNFDLQQFDRMLSIIYAQLTAIQ